MQVDKGAIRPILAGANIMCRGLTSAGIFFTFMTNFLKGGKLFDNREAPANTPVLVKA